MDMYLNNVKLIEKLFNFNFLHPVIVVRASKKVIIAFEELSNDRLLTDLKLFVANFIFQTKIIEYSIVAFGKKIKGTPFRKKDKFEPFDDFVDIFEKQKNLGRTNEDQFGELLKYSVENFGEGCGDIIVARKDLSFTKHFALINFSVDL
jgi:hypothetical protein